MNLSQHNCPVYPGQQCQLCLTDGSRVSGTLITVDDTIIGLDDVSGFAPGGSVLIDGGRALFPIANISWIAPLPDAPTTTMTNDAMLEVE